MVKTIHFVVAFWGEVYAKAFSEYLMPSLLAPNNLPKLLDAPDVEGVLFICTTIADLDRISNNLIYAKLKEFVDIEFIDIGERPIERAPSLHMSYGHKLAISEVIKRKGYLSMLSPDAILADGSVATVIEHVSRGKRCILFPALRFDEQKCVSELSGRGYLKTDEIINISCRELVDVGLDNMHSWQKTFEFDKPYFSNVAIMAYFPLPDLGIAVFHASWGIAAADLGSLPLDYLSDLDADTIDGHFIDRCFFAPEHDRVPKLLSDSDDFFMLPLTPGETMSCEHLMSEYEGEGSPQYMNDIKLLNIRIFVGSFMSNDFKRWAYKEPSILHKGELNEAARSRISSKTDIILKAIEDPEEGPPVHFHLFANSMQEVAAINTVTFPSLLTRHNLGSKHISKGSSLTIYGEPSALLKF